MCVGNFEQKHGVTLDCIKYLPKKLRTHKLQESGWLLQRRSSQVFKGRFGSTTEATHLIFLLRLFSLSGHHPNAVPIRTRILLLHRLATLDVSA